MLHTTTIERDGEELNIEVDAEVTPARAGCFSGPPEFCYPDEPAECEIVSVIRTDNGEAVELTDEERERVRDEIAEAAGDADEERELDLSDAKYEAWRDRECDDFECGSEDCYG